jgi:hypothetical protein
MRRHSSRSSPSNHKAKPSHLAYSSSKKKHAKHDHKLTKQKLLKKEDFINISSSSSSYMRQHSKHSQSKGSSSGSESMDSSGRSGGDAGHVKYRIGE